MLRDIVLMCCTERGKLRKESCELPSRIRLRQGPIGVRMTVAQPTILYDHLVIKCCRYLCWLTQLRLHLHQAPEPGTTDHQQLMDQPLLYLPDGTYTMKLDWDQPSAHSAPQAADKEAVAALASGSFCSLRDIYLPSQQHENRTLTAAAAGTGEVPEVALMVAHYLCKGLISQESNSEYLLLSKVLLRLGVSRLPSFQETVLALNVMAASATRSLPERGAKQGCPEGTTTTSTSSSSKNTRSRCTEERGGRESRRRVGSLTELEQLQIMEFHLYLEHLLEQEAMRGSAATGDGSEVATSADTFRSSRSASTSSSMHSSSHGSNVKDSNSPTSTSSSNCPSLFQLLLPDTPLRLQQNPLWRWHLSQSKHLKDLLAGLCSGITMNALHAAANRFAGARCGKVMSSQESSTAAEAGTGTVLDNSSGGGSGDQAATPRIPVSEPADPALLLSQPSQEGTQPPRTAAGSNCTAPNSGSDDEYAHDDDTAHVGVRQLVPLLDHRRALLRGLELDNVMAVTDAALAAFLKARSGLAAHLVRAELVRECPLLMAALEVPYVEHRGLLIWECNR